MDLGTAIIALIVVIISILPFALVNISNKKKKKETIKTILAFAKKYNYTISEYDIWGKSAIGIDESAHMLFSYGKINRTENGLQFNLRDIEKCKVLINGRPMTDKANKLMVIDLIELAFSYNAKNKEDTVLEFYNKAYDNLHISNELELAEKWCKQVITHSKAS